MEVFESIGNLIRHRDKLGIFSLSKVCDDELLWAHYANSHYGFCIEYDFEKLTSHCGTDWFYFPVTYAASPPTLNLDDVLASEQVNKLIEKMIGYKSKRWSYENEVRIVCQWPGAQPCDFRSVISIYFGFKMCTEQKWALFGKMRGRGVKYYEMELSENSYDLTAKPVDDPHPEAPKYRGRLAPVQEYAIDASYLKEEWKRYAVLMPKVAELARRHPCAESVEMVEVSADKSSEDNPVFFAQIKKGEVRYENIYYSVADIESQYAELELELI